jgi:membrane protein implicated in regulation of membrane protease activity
MDRSDAIKILWVALAVVLSTAEIAVPGFFLLPFGLGAAVGAVVAFLDGAFVLQLAAFVVASAVFFALLRPLARRLNQIEDPRGVGANRLLRQRGVVIQASEPNVSGLVRIDSEDWPADPANGAVLEVGTIVTVVEVRGTRVLVVPEPAPEGPST